MYAYGKKKIFLYIPCAYQIFLKELSNGITHIPFVCKLPYLVETIAAAASFSRK